MDAVNNVVLNGGRHHLVARKVVGIRAEHDHVMTYSDPLASKRHCASLETLFLATGVLVYHPNRLFHGPSEYVREPRREIESTFTVDRESSAIEVRIS